MYHVACIYKRTKGNTELLRKPEQEELLGGKCNKECLQEIGWEDWIVCVRLMIRVTAGFLYTS